MRNTIVIVVISLLVSACGKDKFSTTPKLTFKEVNTTKLTSGNILEIKLGYTDLEGDLQDSIYVEKYTYNCVDSRYHEYYTLPPFPVVKNSEGEIIISQGYNVSNYPQIQSPQCNENDTCYFRFMIQDEAKHKSDTVQTDVIVIYK